jgi:phosphatidylinositol alpha-1,6-mannosyltransferase
LLTELFPPAIGGSAELLWNVYSRLDDLPVRVIAGSSFHVDRWQRLALADVSITYPDWGVLNWAGLTSHLMAARHVVRQGRSAGVIHCARLLPEGLSALLSRALRPLPFVCWTHGEELAYAKQSRELSWLLKMVLSRSTAVIANCLNTAAKLEALGTASNRIHVVYPGVDADGFTPNPAARARLRKQLAPRDELLLLTVGRLERRKGHDLVINTLADLTKTGQSVRYVVVGDGAERERLEGLAGAHNLGHLVTFEGAVPREQLADYYRAADVFVHPNRVDGDDFEGFGMVFLEAAAAGLPTIGGASGGVPEAVQNGTTGFLVSGTDVLELGNVIRRLIDSAGLRGSMGEAGRRRILTEFTWQRAAGLVSQLHQNILRRGPRPFTIPGADASKPESRHPLKRLGARASKV